MTTMRQYRQALRDLFGDRQYRITREGKIEVYGTMPNTNQDGWYLYGYLHDAETDHRLFGE